jgi:hypothetical protein
VLTIDTGFVRLDTTPKNMTTHQLNPDFNHVFISESTGVTTIGANDWDVKYTETLKFQLDSKIGELKFCDMSLKQIDCKYSWICLKRR